MNKIVRMIVLSFLLSAMCIGCAPTYSKEKFNESIIAICKNEYKVDVKVATVGKTIAIYLPLSDLIDFTFMISKTASEKINDVILSVSRVALSTDAKFDFYCIIAHDVRIPEIQIVIVKSVDDVKRFLLNDISRDDYSKRMLVDMRMSPQAQKERSIKEVFDKMGLDRKAQDQMMNDFFRSEPSSLGDIGYWNDRFFIKDVSQAEFLAEQIASRIKIEFKEDKKLSEEFFLKSVKGRYSAKGSIRSITIEVVADPKTFKGFDDKEVSESIYETSLKIAATVLRSYSFTDFTYIEIVDQNGGRSLKVSAEKLEAFRKKKIKLDDILGSV